MAIRKAKTRAIARDDENPFAVLDDDVSSDTDEILAILKAAAGEGGPDEWKIKVYQVMRNGASEPWLFDLTVPELDTLTDRCLEHGDFEGTTIGKFRCRVLRNRKSVKQFDREIMKKRGPVVAPTSGLENIMRELILENRRSNEQLLIAIQQRPAAAATGGIDDIGKFLGAMKDFQSTFQQPVQSNQGIEMFRAGMEIMKEVGGRAESGGASGVMDVLSNFLTSDGGKELAGALASAVRQNAQPQQQPRQIPQQQQPTQIPQQPAPIAPAAPAGNFPPDVQMGVQYVLGEAAKGADPGNTAEYVLAFAGDQLLEVMLDGFESQEKLLEYLEQVFPDAKAHHAWMSAFVKRLYELADEAEGDDAAGTDAADQDPPAAAAGANGHARNAQGDARARAPSQVQPGE